MGYFPIAAFVFFFLQIYHIRLFLFTVVDNPVDNPNILICYMLITRAYFKLTSPWRVIFTPDEEKIDRNSGPYFPKF